MTALAAVRTQAAPIAPLVEEAIRSAERRRRPVLVGGWLRVPAFDPVTAFERAERGRRVLWLQPEAGVAMVGSGAAASFVAVGPERFARALSWWRTVVRDAAVGSGPLAAPLSLGGFSFDPAARRPGGPWSAFADADFAVPAVALVRQDDEAWALLSATVEPGAEPRSVVDALGARLDHLLQPGIDEPDASSGCAQEERDGAYWREAVSAASEAIDRGALLKVVLAREVVARAEGRLPAGAVLRRLTEAYGNCTIFGFERDGAVFLGATPERLVRLDGRRVRAACLAGSRPRGSTPAEDETLGEALRSDRKERFEHALVVRALRDALEPLCETLVAPDEPQLLRVRNVQHLYTPVEGFVRKRASVLELVARLHPTPAVGGVPREAALAVIRRSEPFDRGWYAGPVGWTDASGSGEFVVALRSALLREREARLYAGCGVVAGSDPAREWEESNVKLRAMRWALHLSTADGLP